PASTIRERILIWHAVRRGGPDRFEALRHAGIVRGLEIESGRCSRRAAMSAVGPWSPVARPAIGAPGHRAWGPGIRDTLRLPEPDIGEIGRAVRTRKWDRLVTPPSSIYLIVKRTGTAIEHSPRAARTARPAEGRDEWEAAWIVSESLGGIPRRRGGPGHDYDIEVGL